MNCENKGASTGRMYFGAFNENGNVGIEIGTNDEKWGSSGGPRIGLYLSEGAAKCYVLEADVFFSDCFVTGTNFNALSIAFCGADGTEYTTRNINAVPKEEGGFAYDVYGVTVEKYTWVNIGVEYYPAEGVVKYYANGTLMITDEVASTDAAMSYIKLGGSEYGGSYVRIDDLYFGKHNPHLTESDEYYTFNDGKVPENFSTLLQSEGASLTVTDYPMITSNEKVLALVTKPGKQDFFYVPVKVTEGGDKIVFETKLKVSAVVNSEFKFEFTGVNNKVFGAYNFSINPDGKVSVSHFYNDYNDATDNWSFSTAYVNVTPDSWVDFKLVGYVQDGAFRVDMYVNGDKAATSTHAGFAGTTLADITHFRYQAFSAMDAVIYFDDFKVAVIKEEQQ
jgi:hypothetical protein